MKPSKSVLILTPGFPENEEDSACLTYLQDFTLSFSRQYPQIALKIIAFQYPFHKGHYIWNNISVYSVGGRNSKLLRPLTWLKVIKELYKQYRSSEIVVIQSFWLTECAWIGQVFSTFFDVPHVACALGQDVKKENKYLRLLRLNKLNTVGLSEAMAETFYRSSGQQLKTIIPFGIDLNKFSSTPEVRRDIDIIGVGSLSALKNYTLFVEIVAELKISFPQIKSFIIGEGPEMNRLTELISQKDLQHNITLTGSKPHTDVASFMRRSKVLLHTSHYEGQSMVMMEAQAAGLTVVSFNLGNLHDEKRKIICNTKEEMTEALKKLFHAHNFDHSAQVFQTMDETTKTFATLYGIKETV